MDVLFKISCAATIAGATALEKFDINITLPYFGVPLTVLAMSAAGALASFAYGRPVTPRRRLFGLALTNTLIGAAAIGVVPDMMGWVWLIPEVEAPAAFFAALLCRWVVPVVVDNLPPLINHFMPGKKKDDPE